MDEMGKEPKKSRSSFEPNTKYRTPEVEQTVVRLRDDGKTWDQITEVLRVDLDEPTMHRDTARKIHTRAMGKTITTEKRAGKKFENYTKELDKMYGKAIRVIDRWINAAEKLSEKLEEEIEKENIDAIKAYSFMLKSAPQMKAISSEIRDYMRFQLDQQDKIKTEQTALVWDESQMLDYMEKYLNKLETEGKIRFIKPKV